jgi:uncharacterized protein (TIGR02246 family)
MRRTAILAICLGLCAAPAFAQSKAAIQKLDDQWSKAFNTGDIAALGALYAKDAYLLPNGAKMVKGRAEIEKFWKGALNEFQDVQCSAVDVKPLGRGVLEIGTCSAMTKKAPLKEVDVKFVVVYKKEGGKWRAAADIWNRDK